MLRSAFPDYELKFSQTMRGIHTAIFILKKYKNEAQIYQVKKLKAGAHGYMGTKGGLSTTILFMGELIQFINCHLASGQEGSSQRNSTLLNIM